MIRATIELELAGRGNGWTDVTRDVHQTTIRAERGIRDRTGRERVAGTGTLTFALRNDERNSAQTVGYYTPGHPQVRAGWGVGCGVRLLLTAETLTVPMWTGTVQTIRPSAGRWGDRLVFVTARDYIEELARKRMRDLPLLVDVDETTAFATLLASVPVQPRALRIDPGTDVLPYAFDASREELVAPLSELQRLAQSTLRLVYVTGDGTLVVERRQWRASEAMQNVLTLTASDLVREGGLEVATDRDEQITRVTTRVAPRRVDPAPVVLYTLEQPMRLEPGVPNVMRGLYTDPASRSRRIGGVDMIAPVPGTDYVCTREADGSGGDVTTSVTVTATYTASSVLYTITTPIACWLQRLQARGRGVYADAVTVLEAVDEEALLVEGEQTYDLAMPYAPSAAFGREVAQYLLHLAAARPQPRHVRVRLQGQPLARAQVLLRREISDRVGLAEAVTAIETTGTRAGYYIQAIGVTIDPGPAITLDWLLVPSDATQYWYLEQPGLSELGYTTRLGFGLIVGHTDVAHADDHCDTPHGDTAHTDTHGDSHGDAAHGDSTHSDSHGDTSHGDIAHSDSHGDAAHGDSPHQDSHSDAAHGDTHGDTAHSDSHGDVSHADSHGDAIDPHFDTHDDEPHQDSHSDGAHHDSHGDAAHGDSHSDTAHSDSHTDTHGDIPHEDVAHSDSHDDAGHQDTAHVDVAHSDTHSDVTHSDAAHCDTHGDMAHGDAN